MHVAALHAGKGVDDHVDERRPPRRKGDPARRAKLRRAADVEGVPPERLHDGVVPAATTPLFKLRTPVARTIAPAGQLQ